jgi:hypothetical protein
MEIFVRLFVWVLNLVYGPRGGSAVAGLTENPMDEIVLRQYEEERKSQRKDSIVESFKSTAAPVPGAVDYDDLKWDSYDQVVETAEQFVFCNGRSTQKIIAKSAFRNRQEIVTLRRVIHRHVRNCELRDD